MSSSDTRSPSSTGERTDARVEPDLAAGGRQGGTGRGFGALFDDARDQGWRGAAFLVPGRLDQALVAVIGMAKAVMVGEPCGGHLVDLRAALDRMDGVTRDALRRRAARLGLEGVLAFAAQALDAAFGARAGRRWSDGPTSMAALEDADLRLVLVAPWALGPERPRWRAFPWALSAGSPLAFAQALGRARLSSLHHRALTRVPRRTPPR